MRRAATNEGLSAFYKRGNDNVSMWPPIHHLLTHRVGQVHHLLDAGLDHDFGAVIVGEQRHVPARRGEL